MIIIILILLTIVIVQAIILYSVKEKVSNLEKTIETKDILIKLYNTNSTSDTNVRVTDLFRIKTDLDTFIHYPQYVELIIKEGIWVPDKYLPFINEWISENPDKANKYHYKNKNNKQNSR